MIIYVRTTKGNYFTAASNATNRDFLSLQRRAVLLQAIFDLKPDLKLSRYANEKSMKGFGEWGISEWNC
jgi:hypothetical protein